MHCGAKQMVQFLNGCRCISGLVLILSINIIYEYLLFSDKNGRTQSYIIFAIAINKFIISHILED